MAIQLSVTARNARLDSIESTAGTSAKLRIYTGDQPADCATAASGTLLVEMDLPSDWMNAAATGQKTKLGTWQDTSANGTGTAGYFRIYDSAGTTCHLQGDIPDDMTLDNTSISTGQQVTITAFTLTDGNA